MKIENRYALVAGGIGFIFGIFLILGALFTAGYILQIKVINFLFQIPAFISKTLSSNFIFLLFLTPIVYFLISFAVGWLYGKIKNRNALKLNK